MNERLQRATREAGATHERSTRQLGELLNERAALHERNAELQSAYERATTGADEESHECTELRIAYERTAERASEEEAERAARLRDACERAEARASGAVTRRTAGVMRELTTRVTELRDSLALERAAYELCRNGRTDHDSCRSELAVHVERLNDALDAHDYTRSELADETDELRHLQIEAVNKFHRLNERNEALTMEVAQVRSELAAHGAVTHTYRERLPSVPEHTYGFGDEGTLSSDGRSERRDRMPHDAPEPSDGGDADSVDPHIRAELLQLIKGAELRSLPPMPTFKVNSILKGLLLFSDWVTKCGATVAAAFPNADLGEIVWMAEFDHANTQHGLYAKLGSRKAAFAYTRWFCHGVKKALATRCYSLALEAAPEDVRDKVLHLRSTYRDGKGRDVGTLGGVFFHTLLTIYQGSGEEKKKILAGVQQVPVPTQAHACEAALTNWRRTLVTISRFGIVLPDLSTLVPVLRSIVNPLLDVSRRLASKYDQAETSADIEDLSSDGELTAARFYEFLDDVHGLIVAAQPDIARTVAREARVSAREARKGGGKGTPEGQERRAGGGTGGSGGVREHNPTARKCSLFGVGEHGCKHGYYCSFKHDTTTKGCLWCGLTGHRCRECSTRKANEATVKADAASKGLGIGLQPLKTDANQPTKPKPTSRPTPNEQKTTDPDKPTASARRRANAARKIEEQDAKFAALETRLTDTVTMTLKGLLKADVARVYRASADTKSSYNFIWDGAAERVFRSRDSRLPGDDGPRSDIQIARAGNDPALTREESQATGEVDLDGDPLLPATHACEKAGYAQFQGRGAFFITKLTDEQRDRVTAIFHEPGTRVITPRIQGAVPFIHDDDAAEIRKDLAAVWAKRCATDTRMEQSGDGGPKPACHELLRRVRERHRTKQAVRNEPEAALTRCEDPATPGGTALKHKFAAEVLCVAAAMLNTNLKTPSTDVFQVDVSRYNDFAQRQPDAHAQVLKYGAKLQRGYLLSLWGACYDVDDFADELCEGPAAGRDASPPPLLRDVRTTGDPRAPEYFDVFDGDTTEHVSASGTSDVNADRTKVLRKVPETVTKDAVKMVQDILQQKRRGLVDCGALGQELRRRLAKKPPLELSDPTAVPHEYHHSDYDPSCGACVAVKGQAADSGVAATHYDAHLRDDETVLIFDFAVNFPVSVDGERNCGCMTVQGAPVIDLFPTVRRDDESVLACLSDAREVFHLVDKRVVVRSDREPALFRAVSIRKQLRAWEWRLWTGIPNRPDTHPGENVVKRGKGIIAALLFARNVPHVYWGRAARTGTAYTNLKAGLAPVLSTLTPMLFGVTALAPLPKPWQKPRGGAPRNVKVAVLGPDLCSTGGAHVAFQDTKGHTHHTVVLARDLRLSDEAAWKRSDGPYDAPLWANGADAPLADTTSDDAVTDNSHSLICCEVCDKWRIVTKAQLEVLVEDSRLGTPFECLALNLSHDTPEHPMVQQADDEAAARRAEICKDATNDTTSTVQGRDEPRRDERAALSGIDDCSSFAYARAQPLVTVLGKKALARALFSLPDSVCDDGAPLRAALARVGRPSLEELHERAMHHERTHPGARAFAVVVPTKAALKGPLAEEWFTAVDDELTSLFRNGVLEAKSLKDVTPDDELLPALLILAEKDGGTRKKARIVACGNFQKVDQAHELFSGTIGHDAWLTLITLMIRAGHSVARVDVRTAYLQSDPDLDDAKVGRGKRRTFLRPPWGSTRTAGPATPGLAWWVRKSIYGLRTASRTWFKTLAAHFTERKFRTCEYDPCIFVRGSVVILTYVDDVIFLGPEDDVANEVDALQKRFDCTPAEWLDQGTRTKPWTFLGHDLWLELADDGSRVLCVSQEGYLRQVLARFGYDSEDFKPVLTLDPDQFRKEELFSGRLLNAAELTTLRSSLGSLGYAGLGSRPDLLAAISTLAEGQAAGTTKHLEALKALFRYLKGTLTRHFRYDLPNDAQLLNGPLRLQAYFDANFAAERARMGVMISVAGSFTLWRSVRQPTLSHSTCEAELVAASFCARELIGLANLLGNVFKCSTRLEMFGDNVAANMIANTQASVRRVRHLDLAALYVRELTDTGRVTVNYVKTTANPADMLTKVLRHIAAKDECALIELFDARAPHPTRTRSAPARVERAVWRVACTLARVA